MGMPGMMPTQNANGAKLTPEQLYYLEMQAQMYQQMANYHQMLLQSF